MKTGILVFSMASLLSIPGWGRNCMWQYKTYVGKCKIMMWGSVNYYESLKSDWPDWFIAEKCDRIGGSFRLTYPDREEEFYQSEVLADLTARIDPRCEFKRKQL